MEHNRHIGLHSAEVLSGLQRSRVAQLIPKRDQLHFPRVPLPWDRSLYFSSAAPEEAAGFMGLALGFTDLSPP